MRAIVGIVTLVVGLSVLGAAPLRAGELALAKANIGAKAQDSAYTPLVVSIPHHLPEAEAERRVKDALATLQKDYGYLITIDHQVWNGPHLRLRATVMGQPARGRIDVGRTRVDIKIVMPSSLSVLIDVAQPLLLKQGTRMLAQQ
jgi:hypothetical protein